jgi:primosomal protein N' (replication factor Y)
VDSEFPPRKTPFADLMTVPQIARVALDVPLRRLFDYRVADGEFLSMADIGYRVRVPFGQQHKIGILVELPVATDIPIAQLKAIDGILRDVPTLPPTGSA